MVICLMKINLRRTSSYKTTIIHGHCVMDFVAGTLAILDDHVSSLKLVAICP